ncbi:MAG: hypothetical protein V1735_04020 [Nanoarchaeota archaeon]
MAMHFSREREPLGFRAAVLKSANSPLEALVFYLHRDLKLRFCDIARLIHRKHNTVMTAYQNARQQQKPAKSPLIPFSLLERATVLEAAVLTLANQDMGCAEIAKLLGKSAPAIHTVLGRAKRKAARSHAETQHDVEQPKATAVPVSLFSTRDPPLRALVHYMVSELGLRQGEVAKLLNRAPATISLTFKQEFQCHGIGKGDLIPLALFQDRRLSVSEHVVLFLSQAGYSQRRIARMMHRDFRTIWTMLDRARRKVPS